MIIFSILWLQRIKQEIMKLNFHEIVSWKNHALGILQFVFWPGLGLPRPKVIVVIPKINSCQNHLRKKTSKSAKYPWPVRDKKRSVEITIHLGLANN